MFNGQQKRNNIKGTAHKIDLLPVKEMRANEDKGINDLNYIILGIGLKLLSKMKAVFVELGFSWLVV